MKEWLIMLMPYFGRWPEWMNLFIESCKWNPDVRWRFYTDCGEPENNAANVDYVHLSFEDYKALVREKLRIEFDPSDRYKLCDLKPAYGDIHARDIAGYRFFGWGDIDLVYGKISEHYTSAVLAKSNALSIREDMFAGHFAILRNSRALRRAYQRIPDYRQALEHRQYREIDERAFYRVFRPPAENFSIVRRVLNRFDPCLNGGLFVHRYTTVLSPSGWYDGSLNYPQRWFWKHGSLTNDRDGPREFVCFHFMRWKTDRYRRNPPVEGEGVWVGMKNILQDDWRKLAADGFCISPAGITPLQSSVSAKVPSADVIASGL
jgi:hypothetical protein